MDTSNMITPDTLTVVMLVAYFEKHCECRPTDLKRVSHSHDCDRHCCDDVWLALGGMPCGIDYRSSAESAEQTFWARYRICADINDDNKATP